MDGLDAVLLAGGGLGAGIVNSMAGGGSLVTVPLLTLAGVPGNVANGTNRIGVLWQTGTSALGFSRRGVSGVPGAKRILVPVMLGSLVGSIGVSRLADDDVEVVFGLLMVPLVLLSLRRPNPSATAWSAGTVLAVFFAIGVYGGAFQAGIGLILLVALARMGVDLVVANAIKVVVTFAVTVVALPVFLASGDVDWAPGLVLASGAALGGWVGAHIAVAGGERIIRPVMVIAVLALSGHLLGFY